MSLRPLRSDKWTLNGRAVRHLLALNAKQGRLPATARDLADMTGKSESYISHLLTGRKHSPAMIIDIAAALGIVDWRVVAMPRCEHTEFLTNLRAAA